MKFVQHYLDCLSQASYLIADETSRIAAVVDPRRDIEPYLADAEADGLTIAHVIETHFHADFLSGHLELAEATGAEIVYGAAADPEFAIRRVRDGDRIELGTPGGDGVTLEIRETPGHTPESISIVVWERSSDPEPFGVLTGDTLFIGDVGRPDLLSSVGVTADDLARSLYASIHDRLLILPDATKVFPAHGAGSACGKDLSTETVSTIGEQRRTNYALQPMAVDEFVAAVTENQRAAPSYFAFDAGRNKQARELRDPSPPVPLSVDEVRELQREGTVVVDTRDPTAFAAGHLRGAVNVGIDGRYAEFVGTVVDPTTPIVLVTDDGREDEAKVRLGRIGFDAVVGVLAEGVTQFVDHPDDVEPASRLTAAQLAERRRDVDDAIQVVDIRNPGEVRLGSIPGALAIPLSELRGRADELDLASPLVVLCAGGYRSSIAASLLRSLGGADVSDLLGGYGAWAASSREEPEPGRPG